MCRVPLKLAGYKSEARPFHVEHGPTVCASNCSCKGNEEAQEFSDGVEAMQEAEFEAAYDQGVRTTFALDLNAPTVEKIMRNNGASALRNSFS